MNNERKYVIRRRWKVVGWRAVLWFFALGFIAGGIFALSLSH